jgi:hypothetical protein
MSTVQISGPLFDGIAAHAVDSYLTEVERVVGQYAFTQVKERLGEVLQHPTGYYESKIQTERRADGTAINDGWPGSGVLYGPWLEGVGSRNQTTRFKGYATFRMIGQQVERQAAAMAQEILQPYLETMN